MKLITKIINSAEIYFTNHARIRLYERFGTDDTEKFEASIKKNFRQLLYNYVKQSYVLSTNVADFALAVVDGKIHVLTIHKRIKDREKKKIYRCYCLKMTPSQIFEVIHCLKFEAETIYSTEKQV